MEMLLIAFVAVTVVFTVVAIYKPKMEFRIMQLLSACIVIGIATQAPGYMDDLIYFIITIYGMIVALFALFGIVQDYEAKK